MDATVLEWSVRPGDHVTAGDVIATIETAKTEGDLEAQATGVITDIMVKAGETVVVGTVLAILEVPE